jgi:hypothetical protein
MRETVLSELGVTASWPVARALGMAVILNPFAGRFVDISARCPKRVRNSANVS